MFTEEGILRDTEKAEEAIKRGDAPGIVSATSNIARRANRVLQMAQQEADNSEDPRFVEHVNEAVRNLRASKWSLVVFKVGIFIPYLVILLVCLVLILNIYAWQSVFNQSISQSINQSIDQSLYCP